MADHTANYFACSFCTAKWFTDKATSECPRCGRLVNSPSVAVKPWNREAGPDEPEPQLQWAADAQKAVRQYCEERVQPSEFYNAWVKRLFGG